MKTSDQSRPDAAPSPRWAALDILMAVTGEGRLFSERGPEVLGRLGAGDGARAQRLALETLRWAQRADRMIGRHVRQRPPEDVLNVLRLGIYEIHVAGEAPHGVVSSLVSLTRARTKEPGLARMVNAVMRKIAVAEDWEQLPLPELPKPIRKRLVNAYGKDRVRQIEAVHAMVPPLDLTPRGDAGEVANATRGMLLDTGSVRLAAPAQVSALPGFEAGDWWVQDAAAAMPARLVHARAGEKVLDLCAAPGGKTMQLAGTGADVTALDISEARAVRLRENLERTGLSAEVVIADALEWSGGPFDAVLLDAPCSATGTMRRHPDLPHAKRDLDLAPLLSLQSRLLDRALTFLRPGGLLVYCTCSLYPEEGELQISAVLERHAELQIDPVSETELSPSTKSWLRPDGTLRITPESWADIGGVDGFYIARLKLAEDTLSADDRAERTG